MKYQARFHLEGNGNEEPGMNYLRINDEVELTTGQKFRVLSHWVHEGRLIYQTDNLGLVWADELERM